MIVCGRNCQYSKRANILSETLKDNQELYIEDREE